MKNNRIIFFLSGLIGLLMAFAISYLVSGVYNCSPMIPFAAISIVALAVEASTRGKRASNMLFDLVINDTSYSGTFASYFWIPATFGLDSVRKGITYVQDGIKKKHTIGRVDYSFPLQERVATPTSGGQWTIDGRVLEPQSMMAYTEMLPSLFEAHWLAEQLSPTLLSRKVPITAENYMLQIMLNRAFESIETMIWMGSVDYAAIPFDDPTGKGQIKYFDGFMKKFVNDSDILAYASPAAITTSNIPTFLDGLITLIAINKKALLSNPNRYQRMKFLVSIATAEIYNQYITTGLTFKGLNTMEQGIKPWKGYDIVPIAGMPDDTIVFCEAIPDPSSNLYIGMNSMEDNTLEINRVQNNSELYFMKGLMKYDVQYGFSEQIAIMTTLVAGDFS